jgi:uncharacterized phage infection (PIP) family protein YhgE
MNLIKRFKSRSENMQQAFRAFFKQPSTLTGIVAAVMFQIIFSVVWLTGYDGVTERTHNLKIAMVNQDPGVGGHILNDLRKTLPFQTYVMDEKSIALDKLNNREVHMVLLVPEDFSKQLQAPGGKARLEYMLNESNPAMIKSIMQEVSHSLTESVNKQAQVTADGISDQVTAQIFSINKAEGMANQMIPMMLVLSSFVGSMLMSMNLQQSDTLIGDTICKWKKFFVRTAINMTSAIVIGAIGASLVLALGGRANSGFFDMWGFQSLFLVTFMFFSQVFVLIFGEKGMVFNIIFLSMQLVTSGAMVPRELLSRFYYGLSEYLPATYAAEGVMNLRFGGPSASADIWALLGIAIMSLAVGAGAVWMRKDRTIKPQYVSFNKVA